MKPSIALALLSLFACQTRHEQQAQKGPVIGNDSQAFLASQDTLWLRVCDSAAMHIFFKKIKIGQEGQWFAGLFVEDTLASCLWQQERGGWKVIDTISFRSPFFSDLSCELELPRLEVVDFNEDGHDDLRVPVAMNINGNVWATIYLYDTARNTLRRLQGFLEDNPNLEYDKRTGVVWSEKVAGAYGESWSAYYELRGFKAYPLKKVVEDRTQMEAITHRLYIGKGEQWQLVKTKDVGLDESDEPDFLKEYEHIRQ